MSFSAQLPASITVIKHQYVDVPVASAYQRSCYSYAEKLAGVTNPVCLQSDVIFPNALEAICQPDLEGQPAAVGCRGHIIDREFPLESKTPFAVPLVMYPSRTDGRKHDELDLCAMPVLNWEAYIQEVRGCQVVGRENSKAEFTTTETGSRVNPPKQAGQLSAPQSIPEPEDVNSLGEGSHDDPGGDTPCGGDTNEKMLKGGAGKCII